MDTVKTDLYKILDSLDQLEYDQLYNYALNRPYSLAVIEPSIKQIDALLYPDGIEIKCYHKDVEILLTLPELKNIKEFKSQGGENNIFANSIEESNNIVKERIQGIHEEIKKITYLEMIISYHKYKKENYSKFIDKWHAYIDEISKGL